jgi:hypothetical protein
MAVDGVTMQSPLVLEALVAHLAGQELHVAFPGGPRYSTLHFLAETKLVLRAGSDVVLALEAAEFSNKIVSLLLR